LCPIGPDVGPEVRLQALEVADRPGGLLAGVYGLVCPRRDQDAERDDGDLAERQLPATEKATHETPCSGAIVLLCAATQAIGHRAPSLATDRGSCVFHASASGKSFAVEL
jgi:hypothetical protein